jgi:hypothetical protein
VSLGPADRSSSHLAAVPALALGDDLAATMPLVPGSATRNADDLTATAAANSPITANDADEVTGRARSVGSAYMYGYDSAGNPTLTDVG